SLEGALEVVACSCVAPTASPATATANTKIAFFTGLSSPETERSPGYVRGIFTPFLTGVNAEPQRENPASSRLSPGATPRDPRSGSRGASPAARLRRKPRLRGSPVGAGDAGRRSPPAAGRPARAPPRLARTRRRVRGRPRFRALAARRRGECRP